MADESYFSQIISALRGNSSPQVNTTLAPPLAQYPTQHDADYARNYGFGDNSINEDYLNNSKARVLGFPVPVSEPVKGKKPASREVFVPASGVGSGGAELLNPENSSVVDLNQTSNSSLQGQLTNTMMRAALAANRNPISALGFDPSKVVVDSLVQNPTVGGFYRRKDDGIYSSLSPDDSIVHESTHRGLQKLREQYPDKAEALLGRGKSPDEESVVRWLMHSLAGDPEGRNGTVDAKQRQHALDLYNSPYHVDYNENLSQLQELAIDAMKNRGKRAGPQ